MNIDITVKASHPQFHKDFIFEDGDVVLRSRDAILFRVHKNILSIASECFRDMFSFPQPVSQTKTKPEQEPIDLTEDSKVVSFLLSSLYSHVDHPSVNSYAEIWDIVDAAEKYELPRVKSLFRLLVHSAENLRSDPISLYVLACRCGWKDVIRESSAATLNRPFMVADVSHWTTLRRCSMEDFFRLVQLHATRRGLILNAIQRQSQVSNLLMYMDDGDGFLDCYHCEESTAYCVSEIRRANNGLEQFQKNVVMYLESGAAATEFVRGDRELYDTLIPQVLRDTFCPNCSVPYINAVKIRSELERANLPKSVFDLK